MMVFMSLILVLIGQFCRGVIGRQNVKVVVIGQLLLLICSIRLLFVGFLWDHVRSVRCRQLLTSVQRNRPKRTRPTIYQMNDILAWPTEIKSVFTQLTHCVSRLILKSLHRHEQRNKIDSPSLTASRDAIATTNLQGVFFWAYSRIERVGISQTIIVHSRATLIPEWL